MSTRGEMPQWARAGVGVEHVELVPLTQVKEEVELEYERVWHAGENIAGFTCDECPNPNRPVSAVRTGETEFVGKKQKRVMKTTWVYTKRCSECEKKIKRWQSGQKMAERVILVAQACPEATRVAFVTLTLPNYDSSVGEAAAVRAMKKEVARWRRTSGFVHTVGGVDYFECTVNEGDGSLNAHCHGVWVMADFWAQSEMLKSWARGGVRINECKNPRKAAYYCTSYGSKSPVEGVRCKETWGACRGKKYEDIASGAGENLATMRDIAASGRPSAGRVSGYTETGE